MAEAKSSSRNKIYAIGVVGFLLILSILYYMSAPVYLYIVAYMWFGFLYGVLQQYGRFCFASAWRDLIMVKVPRMFVGIMVGTMVLSIISAFLFVVYPEKYHVANIGPHELVGGLLFGLGMVFAGGCATGSLYKTGEGNMISLTVLLSLSFAQAIFVALPFFDPMMNKLVYVFPSNLTLANLFWGEDVNGAYHAANLTWWQHLLADSFLNTIVIAMILLVGVYMVVVRKGFLKKRSKEIAATAGAAADGAEGKTGFKDDLAGFWHMINSSKRTSIAAILIGIVAAVQIYTLSVMNDRYDFLNFGQVLVGKTTSGEAPPADWNYDGTPKTNQVSKNDTVFDPGYWYITTQEAMFAGWVIQDGTNNKINMSGNNYFGNVNGLPKPWNSPALLLSFGLILGASFLALWNREFKWKFPTRELFVYAVVGGTIMGIGARIALGCNIGGFYTTASFGGPGGWLFFLGMGGGAYMSAKMVNYIANRKMAAQMEDMDFDIEL